MDDYIIITINNTDYYCPVNSAEYLKVIDGYLVNQGTSSITLYGSLQEYQNTSSGYPRIVCPVMTKAYYRSSYNTQTYQTIQVNSISYNRQQLSDMFLMSVMIFFALVILIFKGKR